MNSREKGKVICSWRW